MLGRNNHLSAAAVALVQAQADDILADAARSRVRLAKAPVEATSWITVEGRVRIGC
jgi:hypothetical protein